MPSSTDTAYPRLKAYPTVKDLDEIYTPNLFEVVFAEERTRQPAPRVGLLLLLKTFQRLGYFVPDTEIPPPIVSHIARCAGYPGVPEGMVAYDASTARDRHMALVRAFVGVTAYGHAARQIIVAASLEAARTRDDLADIINVAIEELVRQRYELPAFGTLLRIARAARARVNRDYQTQVCDRRDATVRARLFTLLTRAAGDPHSLWDRVKREPKQPTVRHLEGCLAQVEWLRDQHVMASVFADIPDVKVKQFAAEARSLDVTSMNDLPERKRLTLAAAFVLTQMTRAMDDVAEMFLRQVQRRHNKAHEALLRHQAEHADRTDALIALLRDVTLAYKTEGTHEQRFAAIADLLGPDTEGILARCEAHRAVAGHNYLPLLPTFYRGRRGTLFRFLEGVPLTSTSQDQALPQAIAFLLTHKASRQEWLPILRLTRDHERGAPPASLVDLSFVSEKWWPLVTGTTSRDVVITQVDRRAFELCVFSQILLELKSGDLCIPGSDRFSDYRGQLVSLEEYAREITRYGEQAGIPIEGHTFTAQLQAQLEAAAQRANDGFPTNTYVRLEHGEPVLTRLRRQPDPAGLRRLEQLLKERMSPVEILDALSDTEHWLHWTQHFGPISGYEAKLEQPRERYLMTTFCYGCNLGPTQTARSIKGLDRKQVAFVNQRHVTEENLNEASVTVINAYHRFPLQELWGTGTSASADGTKWDLYPQNLLAEYHIRYGGYGGIGYYLIADTYIALFSRFTTCGAWEGHYILDFVTENQSEVRPDTVHADTQGQSAAIFGLAYLRGIQLMPRIRHWKDLHFYRPGPDSRYAHIDVLFTAQVDWELIETLLPDMLRVALSVKAGRITPSAILRRLATYSRKNKLYFAFRELGRVVRTIFLLRYLSESDLRRKIQAATNKSEAFNKFAQWVSFGGSGVIAENVRDEQRKVIKYNHLVANLLIFHTLVTMTRGLQQMREDGYDIDLEALATLSPYQTEHINRFGMYTLNPNRIPDPLEQYLRLLPASEGVEIPHMQQSVSF
jgi:TnpA family transposase